MRADMKHLHDSMISSTLKDTTYIFSPLEEFIPDRGHEIMALLLDPRFCHCNFFVEDAPPSSDDRDRKRAAKALMRTYNDHVLKPINPYPSGQVHEAGGVTFKRGRGS